MPLFAFDSIEELEKIARHAPGAKVYCRIAVNNAGADWPLSKKFGTTLARAQELMLKAPQLGPGGAWPVLPCRQPADRHGGL